MIRVGDVLPSKTSGDFEILNFDKNKAVIKFLETGAVSNVWVSEVRRGKVKDYYKPQVYNTGFLGKGKFKAKIDGKLTMAYSRWVGILRRCYGENDKAYPRYGGRGVRVCEDWHNFQNFAAWFEERYIEGAEIDKDILSRDCKLYSPETCVFVPDNINRVIKTRVKKVWSLPMGVRRVDHGFVARMSTQEGAYVHLGTFSSAHDAFLAYKYAKESYIEKLANDEFDKGTISSEVKDALVSWQIYPY